MKNLLKFGVVLVVFGLALSFVTMLVIRANAVPDTASRVVAAGNVSPPVAAPKP